MHDCVQDLLLVDAPTVSVSGNSILITRTGGVTSERIDVAIFEVVGGVDGNQVASLSGTSDAMTGDISLTSGALPSGTYHVMSTTYPAPATFNNYNDTVVIP